MFRFKKNEMEIKNHYSWSNRYKNVWSIFYYPFLDISVGFSSILLRKRKKRKRFNSFYTKKKNFFFKYIKSSYNPRSPFMTSCKGVRVSNHKKKNSQATPFVHICNFVTLITNASLLALLVIISITCNSRNPIFNAFKSDIFHNTQFVLAPFRLGENPFFMKFPAFRNFLPINGNKFKIPIPLPSFSFSDQDFRENPPFLKGEGKESKQFWLKSCIPKEF